MNLLVLLLSLIHNNCSKAFSYEVYDVGYKTIPDGVLGYIVMELVRPHNYSDEIISSLFAGLEFFKRREVGVDIMGPEPISQDIQLMTNVGKHRRKN